MSSWVVYAGALILFGAVVCDAVAKGIRNEGISNGRRLDEWSVRFNVLGAGIVLVGAFMSFPVEIGDQGLAAGLALVIMLVLLLVVVALVWLCVARKEIPQFVPFAKMMLALQIRSSTILPPNSDKQKS